MNRLVEFPDLAQAREEAAMWIVRRERGLDAAGQAQFQHWCASPANLRMLRQLSSTWDEMDAMQALSAGLPDALAPPAPSALRGWRPALAAGLAAGLVLAGVGIHRQLRSDTPAAASTAAQAYATTVGEHRSLPLADGSVLAINTDSLVEVRSLQGASRELTLVRGEAHFTVAHDATRPFRVQAAGQIIQAVGTAFDVRLHEDGDVEVVVTDGRVKLIPAYSAIEHLDRGQALRISSDGNAQITQLDNDALGARVAWRGGMVVFDGQTLAAALEEFSRYTPTRFVITDTQLRQLRIGGYFPAGDTGFLLEALHSNFGLTASRGADGTIRLDPAR